jgi:hypothetical protein
MSVSASRWQWAQQRTLVVAPRMINRKNMVMTTSVTSAATSE